MTPAMTRLPQVQDFLDAAAVALRKRVIEDASRASVVRILKAAETVGSKGPPPLHLPVCSWFGPATAKMPDERDLSSLVETLRIALAMGADRAILIEAVPDVHTDIEPLAVEKLLAGVVKEEAPGLVLCGKQVIDNDMNATGKMLSVLLGWSQATFASEVAIEGQTAKVTREVDGGLQTIAVKLPTIITVDLRLNEPRYASLPNIIKTKAKSLVVKTPGQYGVDVAPRLEVVKTVEPAGRKAGVKVASVAELIAKLKDEAGVL